MTRSIVDSSTERPDPSRKAGRLRKATAVLGAVVVCAVVSGMTMAGPAAGKAPVEAPAGSADSSDGATTSWRQGAIQANVPNLVRRSNIVLTAPAFEPWQAMPLGNGVAGAAVWAQDGLTAQLNRVDIFPGHKSQGQLVVPGLAPMSQAADYRGTLDIYDGVLYQSGGGMTARTYFDATADRFVVEVTGVDPDSTLTADLKLWAPRTPKVAAGGRVAALGETFSDGAVTTGALAALTTNGRDVSSSAVDAVTTRIAFKPAANGSFRLVVGNPSWNGKDLAGASARAVAGTGDADLLSGHQKWWHKFWQHAGVMKLGSANGEAEYLENLRQLQLYTTASSMRGAVPGSHGAVSTLFNSAKDFTDWSANHFWHFNLRSLVAANFASGTAELNRPYFKLYQERFDRLHAWVRAHMPGTEGLCVPEMTRYDGTGDGRPAYPAEIACDSSVPPAYTVRILTSGPEIALNMWKQYRYTGDKAFLDSSYAFMRDVTLFYLSYAKLGSDGRLHLRGVNSLENQWNTDDPTPDLAAMRVLFPLVRDLARERSDHATSRRLAEAISKIPDFRTVTRGGTQVLAWSATDEPSKNFQNPDLEPVWPWGVFSQGSQLALDTFKQRVYPQNYDWGMDATWAARLGQAQTVRDLLIQGTKDFQIFPNGLSLYVKNGDPASRRNFYMEWNGGVATALNEALVQSHGGLLRIAPAWPAAWDATASQVIEGGHTVDVEMRSGAVQLVGVRAKATEVLRVRNPWPGEQVRVFDAQSGTTVMITKGAEFRLPLRAGAAYGMERTSAPISSMTFEKLTGEPATTVKRLGTRTIGIVPQQPCVAPTQDSQLAWDPESGTTVPDTSGLHRDGKVVGTPAYVAGPDGQALQVGPSAYLTTADAVSLGRLEEITVDLMVKPGGTGYRRLVDQITPGSSGDTGFLLDLTPEGKLRWIGANAVVVSGVQLTPDSWQRVTVTLDKGGTLKFYVGGVLKETKAIPPAPIVLCATRPVVVGADQNGGSRLIGAVDRISISARAIAPGQG